MSNRVDPVNSDKGSGGDSAMPAQEPKSRRTKSLVEITRRFLRLLQESEDGILDLKEASAQISFHHRVKTKKMCFIMLTQ